MDHHAQLTSALARLEAHKANLREGRERLRHAARDRINDLNGAIAEMENARRADEDDGGILTHRAHRTLLDERERLTRIAFPAEQSNLGR